MLQSNEKIHSTRLVHAGFGLGTWAMSLSLLKFVGQASLVDDAMLPS